MPNRGDITIREDRTLKLGPFDDLPSGAESWNYIVAFRKAGSGADLTSATFGGATDRYQDDDGNYYWLVALPSAKTALLETGYVQMGVWRTGSGTEMRVNRHDDFVTVNDRPGNAS